MLSMELAPFRQSSSRAKATDASCDLGCDSWSTHQPRPPYQTRALATAGGVIYVGLRHVATFSIRSQWQDPDFFLFFVIRVYYEKLGHILKPLVPKFRSDIFARFLDIAEKQVPANLKPIAGEFVLWGIQTIHGLGINISELLSLALSAVLFTSMTSR